MDSKIQFYKRNKGWRMIKNLNNLIHGIFIHICNVLDELAALIGAKKKFDEPIVFEGTQSKLKEGEEALNISLDLNKRKVGFVNAVSTGFRWIEDTHTKEKHFLHYLKIREAIQKFMNVGIGGPVILVLAKPIREKKKLML